MHTQAVYRYSCMPALERLLSTNEIHLRISSYTTKLYDLYSTFTPFEHTISHVTVKRSQH